MRKCFVLLLDLLIFVDRISRFSLAIADRTRRFRIYKICQNAPFAFDAIIRPEQAYSLFEYNSEYWIDSTKKPIAENVSLEQARLTCAVTASSDDFVLIEPNIIRRLANRELCASAAGSVSLGVFSFVEQLEPFKIKTLIWKLAIFPMTLMRLLYSYIIV